MTQEIYTRLAKLTETELDARFDVWIATMPEDAKVPSLLRFMRLAYKQGAIAVLQEISVTNPSDV